MPIVKLFWIAQMKIWAMLVKIEGPKFLLYASLLLQYSNIMVGIFMLPSMQQWNSGNLCSDHPSLQFSHKGPSLTIWIHNWKDVSVLRISSVWTWNGKASKSELVSLSKTQHLSGYSIGTNGRYCPTSNIWTCVIWSLRTSLLSDIVKKSLKWPFMEVVRINIAWSQKKSDFVIWWLKQYWLTDGVKPILAFASALTPLVTKMWSFL